MRQSLSSWLVCALVQAVLMPPASCALAHASPAHGEHARLHAESASRHSSKAGVHHSAHQLLARERRTGAHLHSAQPAVTALIDPVPRGRFPFPAPLKGSHESLVRQNVRSQRDGLERIQDDADIVSLRRSRQLVALPVTAALTVDERLPENRRYTRPWTAQFLTDLSRVHYARFHRSLQVNSAVRTVEYQRHLELVNGNAAPADGDDASPHLTGATVDLAKKGLSMSEIGWMRAYLMPLQAAGKIDVEEEFYQSCFHITVYRAYHPPEGEPAKRGGNRTGSSRTWSNGALLAARVP
jgi:hypothetical protein